MPLPPAPPPHVLELVPALPLYCYTVSNQKTTELTENDLDIIKVCVCLCVCVCVCLCVQDIVPDPRFFIDKASADDFSQGILGNCWFVAACACIAEDSTLWKKVSA